MLNEHFSELFVRLFGGGRAHLALTEAEDPLDAGLEIMASPPGKRLQALSLLSGGEQALTAIALIFAVFLTNPAPICVLDEVDAPLDDANVERFCRLVAEIADTTGTRFLLITHHRITMARMDRLFGVTMAERASRSWSRSISPAPPSCARPHDWPAAMPPPDKPLKIIPNRPRPRSVPCLDTEPAPLYFPRRFGPAAAGTGRKLTVR